MPRVEFRRNVTALLSAADVRHSGRRRPAARRFVHHFSIGPLQSLPLLQTNPIPVLQRQFKPVGETLRRIVGRRRGPGGPLRHLPAQHLAKQARLVAEIVIEHPLVDGRPARDDVHAGAGKALGGKLLQGRGQNPFARAFRVARAGFPPGCCRWKRAFHVECRL